MQGAREFPMYSKLPEVLLQPAYTGGRAFKRAPKNDMLQCLES